MKLSEVAKAVASIKANHSILIYSPPKMGKTRLAGTAAKIKEIRRIWWFDGENGSETLLNMGLTEEEMDKIILFKIRDTRDEPIFIETVLKAFNTKEGGNICDLHGRWECAMCKKEGKPSTRFCMRECGHNDLVVLDSGSALADSAMAALCLNKGDMFKPGWDEFGIQGKWLGDVLTVVQQATWTNFVILTHEICVENDEGKDMFFPLMGTKSFCMKVSKYFGTVVYLHKKMNKHAGGSSSTYMNDRITGSRVNAEIEKGKDAMDMRTILIGGGILKEGDFGPVTQVEKEKEDVKKAEPTVASETISSVQSNATVPPVKLSFADRIKLKEAGK